MSDYPLKLGDAGFALDDLPESLPLGGEQAVAVRKFPGGGIQVQALGAYDREMSWQGEFLGDGAWDRAQAIGNLRIAGKELLLQFGTITRYVIITKFEADYRHDGWVGYSITLQPSRKSGEIIGVGAAATIISASGPQSSGSADSNLGDSTIHYIQTGDTFWKLAERQYGDGSQWTKIAAANPGVDYGNLQLGQKIIIPT